jgi:fibronectin type 3 domain-containing protein
VDTHPIHTHLFHTQIINRVDQSGQFVGDPVDPIEHGWKDTVRINPLEVTFLAMRPTVPTPDQVPFEVPDSIRLIDPALPLGATLPPPAPAGWFDPTGFQLEGADTPVNHYVNFGWEYVWHCHILSHEEMDMMHAIVFAVPPRPPFGLSATTGPNQVNLTWTDGSIKEASFKVERASDTDFRTGLTTFPVATVLDPNTADGTFTFRDTTAANNSSYWYRVYAIGETVGDTFTPNFPTMAADSVSAAIPVVLGAPTTGVPANPTLLTSIPQAGPQVQLTWRDNATTESGFRVERCIGAGCTGFAAIATTPGRNNVGSVTYTDTTVTPGNTYFYRVFAVNANGDSALPTNTTSAPIPVVPAVPTIFTVSIGIKQGNNYPTTLRWDPYAPNPTNFTIQRATNLDFTTGRTTFTPAGAARSLTMNLARNTTYYFRIRANNSISGSSAWKNAAPFPIRTGN